MYVLYAMEGCVRGVVGLWLGNDEAGGGWATPTRNAMTATLRKLRINEVNMQRLMETLVFKILRLKKKEERGRYLDRPRDTRVHVSGLALIPCNLRINIHTVSHFYHSIEVSFAQLLGRILLHSLPSPRHSASTRAISIVRSHAA